MRIKRVEVKKLFGMFDHKIDFKLNDRITIIHGVNGLGKTAILKLINGFYNSKFSDLRSTPFAEFRIVFDDDSTAIITKEREKSEESREENGPFYEIVVEYRKPGEPPRIETIGTPSRPEEIGIPIRYLEDFIPGITRVGPDSWRVSPGGEIYTFEELIENFGEYLPASVYPPGQHLLFDKHLRKSSDWLRELRSALNVRFIETQRLVTLSRPGRKRGYESSSVLTPAVVRYSSELASLIQRTFTEYGTLSQELDRTFPMRVFAFGPQETPSVDQLQERLSSLEKKRARLREAGLLGKEAHPYFVSLPPIVAEDMKNMLFVYTEDIEQKLNVFAEVAKKIELLKQFVKDHFLNKELHINRERGFILVSTETKVELTPTQLSSGEQHELVLIYELLFRVRPNSLILIDEPEISLHVDWQLQFLKDIQNVISLSPFDVLLATHSPLIINERWDLTEELVART